MSMILIRGQCFVIPWTFCCSSLIGISISSCQEIREVCENVILGRRHFRVAGNRRNFLPHDLNYSNVIITSPKFLIM